MSAKRESRFSDQLRQAVDQSALGRCEICKRAGLDQCVMHRLMHKKSGLSMATVGAVCEILGLRLVAEGKPRKRRGG